MKKVLYSLLLFISILFVSYKVSAETYDNDNVIYFDTKHSNFTTVYEELKPKLEEIKGILDNNPLNHKYAVFFGKNSSGNFINVYLMAHNANYNLTDMFCFTTGLQGKNVNTGKSFYDYYSGCYSEPPHSPYNFARYEYKSSDSSSYDTLITNLSNDILLEWTSSKFKGKRAAGTAVITTSMLNFSFTNNVYDYFNNNTYFSVPYTSNVSIYNRNYYSSTSTHYALQFGDTKVLTEEYLEPSDNYFKEEVIEPYIFDEEIDDIDYSKMIFDFDLSIYSERNNVFDLLLNDFYVSNDIRDSILYEVEPFEIGYPYFEYTTSTGFKGIFYLKDLEGNDIKSNKSMYTGKYLDTLPDDTVSLRFIVPLLDTIEYQLKVSLVTFYPFTVSYETDEDYFSSRETLVFNGKYGAIFMPKLVENNSDVFTFFSTRCIDKILVYDSYDYKKEPIEVYDDISNDFYYRFDYNNLNYNLFFLASTGSSCSYSNIEYDTKYFDYQVVDTKYTVGTVVNPNTGETHYIDYSNTSNLVSNFDSISGVFEYISEQLDKNNSAYLLFHDSVNVFFNTMPGDVYVLILTVFSMILLGVTLALGGWK